MAPRIYRGRNCRTPAGTRQGSASRPPPGRPPKAPSRPCPRRTGCCTGPLSLALLFLDFPAAAPGVEDGVCPYHRQGYGHPIVESPAVLYNFPGEGDDVRQEVLRRHGRDVAHSLGPGLEGHGGPDAEREGEKYPALHVLLVVKLARARADEPGEQRRKRAPS